MSKKILAIGDLHCGSMSGLTPPEWMVSKGRNSFFSHLQEEMWQKYIDTINEFGKVDVLIVNGDIIDGKGIKSGGTQLITTDLIEQSEIAINALSYIKADKVFFTYGTPYHTSSKGGEDFDKIVADAFKAKIDNYFNLKVEGVLFNIKHDVQSSSNPNNRSMPVARHRLWDSLDALKNEDEPASVFIRSHVHYYSFCGGNGWYGFTLPALQANCTKFGARRCYTSTDWGMVMFTVDDGCLTGWDTRIFPLMSNKKIITKI